MRPTADQDENLNVLVAVGLQSLGSISETDQTMETLLVIYISYLNYRTAWNSSEYNLTDTYFQIKDVYIPDIAVLNSGASGTNSLTRSEDTKEYTMYLHHCGYSELALLEHLISSCAIDITYYPFDSQRCDIDLVSFPFPDVTLFIPYPNMKGDFPALDMSTYSEDGSWDIVDQRAYSVFNTSVTQKLQFSLILQRKTTYYVLSMLLPLLFLSLTTTVVFALPTDSGEKMGTCMTVLLAYSFYLSIVTGEKKYPV